MRVNLRVFIYLIFFNTAGVEWIKTALYHGRYHGYWTSMPLASHGNYNYANMPTAPGEAYDIEKGKVTEER
ncbi:MAG: hypothetical protein WCE64_05275 [Bacteroidales bacterium]